VIPVLSVEDIGLLCDAIDDVTRWEQRSKAAARSTDSKALTVAGAASAASAAPASAAAASAAAAAAAAAAVVSPIDEQYALALRKLDEGHAGFATLRAIRFLGVRFGHHLYETMQGVLRCDVRNVKGATPLMLTEQNRFAWYAQSLLGVLPAPSLRGLAVTLLLCCAAVLSLRCRYCVLGADVNARADDGSHFPPVLPSLQANG
jgi:hypothetical protein